jgi:hypothetical protein
LVSNPATRGRLWTFVQKQFEKESEQLSERGSGRYEEGEMDRKELSWQSGKDAP